MFVATESIFSIILAVMAASIVLMVVTNLKRKKNPAEEPALASVAPEESAAEPEPQPEPEPEPAEDDEDEDEVEEDEDGSAIAVASEGGEFDRRGKLIYVKDMETAERNKLGLIAGIYDERLYRMTYSYSFKAKLCLADDTTREFYQEFAEEASRYKRVTLRESRRHVRIGIGRDRVGLLFFRGKRLCVAFALSPEQVDYEALRLEDVSDKKRFEQTPAMMRFTSNMRCRRAKELLGEIAKSYGLERRDEPSAEVELPVSGRGDLIKDGEIRLHEVLISLAPAEQQKD